MGLFERLFNKIFFGLISTVAKIVNVLINFIRMVLGLSPLEGAGEGTTDFLFKNFWTSTVFQAFWIIVIIGVSLCFIFAIVKLLKAQFDDKEDGGAVRRVTRTLVESIALMLVLPVFAGALIAATTATAQAIDNATHSSGVEISYSTEIIFSTVEKEQLEDAGENYFNGNEGYRIYDRYGNQVTGMEAVKLMYEYAPPASGEEAIYFSDPDCTKVLSSVSASAGFDRLLYLVEGKTYFKTWILPLLGGCVMMVSLAMSCVTIAQRLFSVIFIFIISPLTVASRPFDDGARFKKWGEMFIGKLLSGYGIVFALNIFFSIVPAMTAHVFFNGGFANGVAKLIIYIAGVIFANGAGMIVSQIIGADAGQMERDQATQNFRALASGAHLAASAVRGVGHGAKFMLGNKEDELRKRRGLPASATAGAASNGAPVSSTIGGAMGKMGKALINGNPLSAAASGAKSVGKVLGRSRIVNGVAGAGMLAAGLAVAPVRAGKALKRHLAQGKGARADKKALKKTRTFQGANAKDKKAMLSDPSRSYARIQRRERAEDILKNGNRLPSSGGVITVDPRGVATTKPLALPAPPSDKK